VRRVFQLILLMTIVLVGLAAPSTGSASASALNEAKLGNLLGVLWTNILQTPKPQNPFTPGGDRCVDLGGNPHGRIVAPFGLQPPPIRCTVEPGTMIFVAVYSAECSTVEDKPFHGTDEASLRACARVADAGLSNPNVTVDGQVVPVTEVETALLKLTLPTDNIFGTKRPTAKSVGHGWVALVHPLPSGKHKIKLRIDGTDAYGNAIDPVTTTIIVKSGRQEG